MALQELSEAAYSCTGCRRCMVYCPHGIDTQMLMSIAKLLLVGAGTEPEILSMLADTSVEKGKSLEFFKEGFLTGIKNLEAQVVEKWKVEAGRTPIPVDVEGADLLYVALAGAHSIIPAAAIFNAAGENWTLSFFEAVNFGAFVGDPTKDQADPGSNPERGQTAEGEGGLHLRMRYRLPGHEAAFRETAL